MRSDRREFSYDAIFEQLIIIKKMKKERNF